MKNLLTFLATIFTVTLLIYAVGYAVPRIIEIYKNKPIEKVDTIIKSDTIYFEKTVTDTMPKYRYLLN